MATKKKAKKKAVKKIVVDAEKPIEVVASKPSLLQSIINWFKLCLK